MAEPSVPAADARSPGLVGRHREQVVLREQLAAALAGQGGVVLIGGEAGIGKTTLAEVLAAEATARGALALVGRCYDLSETPPYGPWLEAFARYPPDPPLPALPAILAERGRLGDVGSQEALFREIADFLAVVAAERPLVLFLDDLHWADRASLDLLRALARQVAAPPILLLVTYRSDEVTRRHSLVQLLPALVREARAIRLDLRRLDDAAVRALLAARYGPGPDEGRLVAYLRAHAEGNPFYLGELLRALEEEELLRTTAGGWALADLAGARVPTLLKHVIAGRLARLGERAERLLAVAAVIGQEVPLDLWAAVSGAGEEELLEVLERAVEGHVLAATPDGTRAHFMHALIREALYEGVLPARRRGWHRQAGEALLAAAAPDPDAVAYHFRRAGDPRAAEWLVRAGARAQRAYAFVAVAERFAAAVAALPDDGSRARERGWLRYRVASDRFTDEPDWSLAELDALMPVAAAADPYLAAYVDFERGMLRCSLRNYRRGLAEMAAGVARLAALPPVERIELAALGGFVAAPVVYDEHNPAGSLVLHLAGAGRLAQACALGEANEAEAPGAAEGTPMRRAAYGDAYNGLGQVYAYLGRPEEARRAFARSREAYRAIGELNQIVNVSANELNLVLVPYLADRVAERRRLLAEAQRVAEELERIVGPRPFARLLCLWVLLLEGRWGEVRALAAAASPWSGPLVLAVARLAREQGEPARAWAVIRERVPDGPAAAPGDGQFQLTLLAQQLAAALAVDAGDLPTARAWLAAHDRWLEWSGSVLYRAEGLLGWAAYHRAAGDPALAHRHAAQALAQAAVPRQPLALLAAHRFAGELDTAAGRHHDAAGHLAEALALAEACAAPYEQALTLLALAELRAATGNRAEAAARLADARAICAPLDAKPALSRIEALAATLDAAAASPSTYPAGLTAREAEVLGLVAAGLTDAQVAERLFVSLPTIRTHLRSIYAKLDVSSRTAAARFAIQHGLA